MGNSNHTTPTADIYFKGVQELHVLPARAPGRKGSYQERTGILRHHNDEKVANDPTVQLLRLLLYDGRGLTCQAYLYRLEGGQQAQS